MNITVIGKGNVGSGLAGLWRPAGHGVTEIGREGGDAADAEVVLVAVPSGAIGDALARVSGLEGRAAIDATNAYWQTGGSVQRCCGPRTGAPHTRMKQMTMTNGEDHYFRQIEEDE